mgnify:CR=1 FL=1
MEESKYSKKTAATEESNKFGKPTEEGKRDPVDKERDTVIDKKKNEALNKRVLKTQKKVVQNNIRTNAQQSRVVRTRNSNGTISVQNPTIDLKPKGGGNGIDFLKR